MSDLVSFGGVDGAVMLDPDGQCHAFGVILDGRAEGRGDPARGSRFNSAIRYQRTMARKSLLVVISDDGTMDLIPNLMPQVHKSEVEAAVDDCRATCSEDIVDGERFALTHERVRKLAFYLKAPSLYSGFGLALLAKAPLGVGSWGAEALATRVAERWAGVRVGIHFLKPYSAIRFMKVAAPSLAPILRSDAQGRILACVLADPDKSHSLSDLVAATGTSMPTVLREVRRGEQAAILTQGSWGLVSDYYTLGSVARTEREPASGLRRLT